jgi:DNA adenine methylase
LSELQQPLKWHGGKHYIAEWVIEHFPDATTWTHYVEPYFGGGSVLLRLKLGKSEYVNDINSNLTSFWLILQNDERFAEFMRKVEQTPFSEVEYKRAQLLLENTEQLSEVRRAWAFFVVARQSRQGLCKDFATMSKTRTRRGMNEQASSWLSAIDGLADVRDRMRGVVISCRPALEVIRRQDDAKTLFYLDPPYLHETRVTKQDYQHEMTPEDHEDLLAVLGEIKGRFVLSGYRSKMYNDFAEAFGWRMVSREIDNKASSKSKKPTKEECLWMNF